MHSEKTNIQCDVFISIISVGLSISLVTWKMLHILNINLKVFLQRIIGCLYNPNYNEFRALLIENVNFYKYLFIILVISILFSLLINKIVRRKASAQTIIITVFVLYMCSNGFQTISFIRDFKEKFQLFSGRSLNERISLISAHNIYSFTLYCKNLIQSSQAAKIVTDLDFSKDPGMFMHRTLAYYLYPIDIRGIRSQPPQYIILFYKKNAAQYVPDNYKIVGIFNEQNIIAQYNGVN